MNRNYSKQIKGKKFLNSKEAAAFLQTSVSTLYKWVSLSLIPCYKPVENGKLYFLESDLTNWIEQARYSSNTELKKKHLNYILTSKGGRHV